MKVLMVDDDPGLRQVLSDILKARGFEPVAVETGAEALDCIEKQNVDVALIDLKLEDVSGLEVLRDIKERSADTECILLTGYASQETAIQALNLGAYSYFQKPYNIEQLVLSIQHACDKRWAGQALGHSEASYRALVEQIPATTYIDRADGSGHSTFISPQIESMLGVSQEAWMQTDVEEWGRMIHPEDSPRVTAAYRRTMETSQPFDEEYRMFRPDGCMIWIEDHAVRLKDASGQPATLHGVMFDITERKQAEREMHQRLTELQLLYENSLAFSHITHPREIAQKIIELLDQKLAWQHTAIRLFHPEADRLELLAFNQPGLENEAERAEVEKRFRELIAHTGQGLSGWAVQHGQSVRSNDLTRDPRYVETFPGLRSGLYVPMKLGERVVGVISIESEQPHAFSEADEQLTLTLAAQAAVAFENARLFNEASRRLSEQAIIHKAGQSLLAGRLDPSTIYTTLHRGVAQIMPCDVFTITLKNGEDEDYQVVYLFDSGKNYPAQHIPRGQGLSGKVISEGKTLFIHDNLQSNQSTLHFGSPGKVRSILAVPLRKRNTVVGMVSTQSYQPHVYNDRHRVLFETLAAQATNAIENARLFEETRDRLLELTIIHQVSQRLTKLFTPEELSQEIVKVLDEMFGYDFAAVLLVDEQTGKLLPFAISDQGKGEEFRRRDKEYLQTLDVSLGQGVTGWSAQNRQSVRLGDVRNDKRYLAVRDGILSELCVPMLSGEQVIGVINIETNRLNAYEESDQRLLETIAAQIAIAIQNASLLAETQRRVTELETINRISMTVRAIADRGTMLAVILEETLSALNLSDGSINLWDRNSNEITQTVARGWLVDFSDVSVQPGEGIFGWAFANNQPYVSKDFSQDSVTLTEVRLHLPAGWGGVCLPIRATDETLGVLLISAPAPREFDADDLRLLNTLAEMTGAALHRMYLNEETTRRLDQLQSLHLVEQAIAGSIDKHITLSILLNQILSQLKVDAADVLLLDPSLHTLRFAAGQGFRTRLNESVRVRVGESFAGRAALERRTILVQDRKTAEQNQDFADFWTREGFSNYYGIPLIAKGQVKGVLELFHRIPFTPTADWLNFLETLSGQAAIAIDNAQLFEHLQSANVELSLAYDATIEGWSRAMDLRDEETEGHTQRVTDQAMALARAAGMGEEEIVHLRRGALLHDIGKIGVPDHILLKAGPLTDEEWKVMRKHPQFAYDMLHPISHLRRSLDIPFMHHEKWDGSGYPQGLKGEQIPLAARIFAILDVYDALTSDRPYRKAWTPKKTLAHIRKQRGKHFDPQLVDIFFDWIADKRD